MSELASPLLLENVACGYAGKKLFSNLSLSAASGELLAIVGPNGAGKTTLLRSLVGHLPLIEGQVFIQGTLLSSISLEERARRLAFMPQQAVTLDGLTIKELVALGRTPHLGLFGLLRPRDRQAIERAMSVCRIEHLARQPFGQVSGGEQQRARLAMIIAQETPLIFFDEPVNHLDLRGRFEFFELLHELRAGEGLTVLAVLHDLTEAYREANRVLVIGEQQAQIIARNDVAFGSKLSSIFGVPEERIAGG